MTEKIRTLVDDFDGASIDSAKWVASAGVSATGSGAAQLTLSYDLRTLTSVDSYDLTDSEVVVNVSAPGPGMVRQFIMYCTIDLYNELSFYVWDTSITLRTLVAGVYSDVDIPFDRTAMAYWKLQESDGVAYWYTSPDGNVWTLRRSTTHGLDVSSLKLKFMAGYSVDVEESGYGEGEYGEGFYGGVSGVPPDVATIYNVNTILSDAPEVPSTVPPRVFVLPRPPRWRFMVGPHQEGPNYELTEATERSVHIRLEDPSDCVFSIPGDSNVAYHISELITDAWIYRGAELVFRGRVTKADESLSDSGSHDLTVTAVDYRGVLDSRILWTDISHDPSATPPTSAMEPGLIIKELIDHTQARLNGDLGITYDPAWTNTGITVSVQFKAGDKIWQCIKQVCDMAGVPDFWIDPLTLVAYFGTKGKSASEEVLDYGGVISSAVRVFDVSKYGNALYQSGAEDLSFAVELSDTQMADAPEGRWEIRAEDSDLNTADAVQRVAEQSFIEVSRLTPTYDLTFAKGKYRGLAAVDTGDLVTVVVKSGRLRDVYDSRVFDITFTVDDSNNEDVSVVTGSSKVDFRSLLKGIQTRIAKSLKR